MEPQPVAAKDLPWVWPHVQPWIIKSCEAGIGDVTPGQIFDMCLYQRAQMFVAVDNTLRAVAVTQVIDQADGTRICNLMACGGERLPLWLHLLELIEAGAK